jgi:hypothetical protein
MTRNSLILGVAAGMVVVVLIVFGPTFNLGGGMASGRAP